MASLSIDSIFSAVARSCPERPAVVTEGVRTTYRQLDEESQAFASFLLGRGLGARGGGASGRDWVSAQDHIGLLMYNCPEYLVAELASVRARTVAINVNYRYVGEELRYIAANADLRLLVFHGTCARQVAAMREGGGPMPMLVQVPDSSGNATLPGAIDYHAALAEGRQAQCTAEPSADDLHILYTGGTTGWPKGVMWRQGDILVAGLGGRNRDRSVKSLDDYLHAASRGASVTLPAGPFMHASGRWTALSQLLIGNTLALPSDTSRFDAADIVRTLEREAVNGLNIVGDAMARPLIAELRRLEPRLPGLRLITSGAAILSQSAKDELLALLPDIGISDTIGSSETGPQASMVIDGSASNRDSRFIAGDGTTILTDDKSAILPEASDAIGWLARSGHIPRGYLGDKEKTRDTFRTIDGIRYAIPGDKARWSDDGRVILLGRDSAVINSGGEKVFAEEVEMALKHHPDVSDAIVCGRPSERWGQEVVAIVALNPGGRPEETALLVEAAKHVARYKLPKKIIFRDEIRRSPSGKPDYAWAREIAASAEAVSQESVS